MNEKDKTFLNITKAIVGVPLVMLAAWGSASGNGLEALLAAAPSAALLASDTIGSVLATRKKQQEEILTFPRPHWWTSDSASWQGLCAEIVDHLDHTIPAINERLRREQHTPTALAIRQAFIEEVVLDKNITWERDPKGRRRAAEEIATPLLQKVADVLKDAIGPTREDALLIDARTAATNTEKIVEVLERAVERLSKIQEEIEKPKVQSSSTTPQAMPVQTTPAPVVSTTQRESVDDILLQKIKNDTYDVFICYNSKDEVEVRKVADKLKEFAILPWLAEDDAEPGGEEQEDQQANQIAKIKAAAVFVGDNGLAEWQHMQTNAFLRQFIKRKCRVIPVLLADMLVTPSLPLFLEDMVWVDFRQSKPNPIERLLWGITGNRFFYSEWMQNA